MAKRKIVWTETAVRQRREIFRYWTVRNGSSAYAEKLIKLIAVRVKVIRKYPEAFIATKYPETRISAMGHFSLLYKFNENEVIITAFWDNRQDPEKLLEIIKD
ncbi:type II toxin-antitoxin system RelE/ParE family toxin [Mucilaginibacter sp.]|uniref:type II toxin-antitoxin system RelE/ParE family toxin n=1 Tax=Mucilaginibacter sp. TaxID=1882438 RepID=UPI0025D84287|nr:type II toxin-antitoxin system RelE/ParE family toxin [Mucilaginibacter sp.]